MAKQVYEIDNNGFIKEIHVEDVEATQFLTIAPPDGLYRAKWTGTEWVEDMSQEEIEKIRYMPRPPTSEERLQATEEALLTLMEVLS